MSSQGHGGMSACKEEVQMNVRREYCTLCIIPINRAVAYSLCGYLVAAREAMFLSSGRLRCAHPVIMLTSL